jgi:hypothetical protein
MNSKIFLSLVGMIGIVISLAACAVPDVSPDPTVPISRITIGDDLTTIDLCKAIPQEDIETVMKVKLVTDPTRYTYRHTDGTSGCYYEGPYDSTNREYQWGYVVLTPLDAYDNQTLFQNKEVSGIGDAAYFNGDPNKRQLWVKIDDKVAFVIAFGDVAKEKGSKALAQLMVEAIK